MMKLKKLLLLAFGLPLFVQAQLTELEVRQMVRTAPEDQLVVEASRMLQENYFYFSEIVVDKLLTIKPESSNYNYRKGYILLDSRQDFISALPFLEKAIKDIDKNYDMYSPKENSAPTDAYYHMARCYHLDEQIDKAVEYYNKFIESSSKKSELLPKAELRLKQCEVAKKLIASPRSAIVRNIGSEVNSTTPEYSPVISLDGQSLYLTSRREWELGETDEFKDPKLNQFPEDIYVSYVDFDGEWTQPTKLSFSLPEINEATIAVSPDERRVYAYQDVTGFGDIYYSDFKNNRFQTLEQIDYENVNTKYWETHCTVTPDGQQMYFVSDRPGGIGGRDIYRLIKLPNGSWSEPMNLGPTINTPYDEDCPFIAVDNKTLYYSSNGESSMGDFDIFTSVRDDNNNWSAPVNLGYPINSAGDDVFYTTTIDGLKGYLSSFRKGGYGEKDIYEILNDYMGVKNVVVLKGAIKNITGEAIPETANVKVKCINCMPGTTTEILPRLRDGAFISSLQACKEYEIIFYQDETNEIRRERFVTSCNLEYEEIYREAWYGDYKLDGDVADRKTAVWLKNAKVEFTNKENNKVLATVITDSLGHFTTDILNGMHYGDELDLGVKVSREGYLTQHFDSKIQLLDKPLITLHYLLEKAEIGLDIGKVFEINPIYFDLDKSDIRPDAQIELDKIVNIMNENPTIVIELGSHTDCRASKAYNKSLSHRRAVSSAKYIQSRIDDPKRIYGKGYGESQLVNHCECEGKVAVECSEEEHQANRRTEFKIVKQ